MDKTYFCDYESCLGLKRLGYNDSSDYTYVNNYRVKDEIFGTYPGLSYNEYLELIDEYGGSYKRDEIFGTYIEPIKNWSRNSMIDDDLSELCSCIHLYDAQRFLREEKQLEICILGQDFVGGPYYPDIYNKNGLINMAKPYDTYEKALAAGIKYAVEMLSMDLSESESETE